MGSKALARIREEVVNRVSSGTLAAKDAYNELNGGAFTRGEFEVLEAQAKAKGLGQWSSLGSSDRQAASTYQPRLDPVAVERNQRNGISIAGQPTGMLLPKATGFGLQSSEGKPSHFSPDLMKRLGNDTSSGPDPVAQFITPGKTIADLQAYKPKTEDTMLAGRLHSGPTTNTSLNSSSTYRNAGGGVVDPTLDQRTKFNPNTNPNWSQPGGATSTPGTAPALNGQNNNNVGKLPPLPTKSAISSVQNPYGATYTGMLLAGAKERAARDYQQREAEMRQRLGAMGATAASAPGLEQQLLTEARQGYQRDYGDYERSLMTEATQLGANFDVAKATSEDAFAMNLGNLGLNYAADARAGMLVPGQVKALELGNQGAALQNEAGSFQNKMLSNDAYYYTSPEAANNRATRDKYATELAGTQYEGASISNAMAGMDSAIKSRLLETTIAIGESQGAIQAAEANAARQIAAQGGEWYENPLFKNILRGLLVGGGALAGGLLLGPAGILPGAAAGGTGAGAIK